MISLGKLPAQNCPGGRIVLLTSHPDLVSHPRLSRTQTFEISVFGQTATAIVLDGG